MSDAPLPFSLLLPVYARDSPAHFAKAFASSVNEQTRRPAEVVIVQDGRVGDELRQAIEQAGDSSPVPVVTVVLEENLGLATALSRGLDAVSHDVVARMDADDISLPERFARQLPVIESGVDLVGSGMFEFDGDGRILGRRTPPTDPSEIARAARLHDPFNHPTVVYRRNAVQHAGGYRELALMEDYWLFARMIHDGATVANLADPLVMYRVDKGAYARRGGARLFQSELRLQRELRRSGFVSRWQFLRNVAVRGGYRFVPTPLRRWLYRAALVGRSGDTG